MVFDFDDADACDAFHMTQIRDMKARLVAHLAGGQTTDMLDTPLIADAAAYTDPAQLERERAAIFTSQPLLACLSSDVAPGSVYLFDAAGPPIVITRDKGGQVRAFLNICMHRGASVAHECGRAAKLVCRFHGWAYNLDGTLAAIPGKAGFEGVDAKARNLVRVPVAEWNGMIFVTARPGDEEIDVAGFLGEFAPQLAMMKLWDAELAHASVLRTDANWKLMLDTHGEGYHFATLHPKTIAPAVVSNVSVYDRFGPHYRVAFAQRSHLAQVGRNGVDDDLTDYSSSMLLFPNTIVFETTFNLGKAPDEAETGKLDTSAFYYGIYRLFPGAHPGETVTYMASYKPKRAAPGIPEGAWRETHEFIAKVLVEEDYAMAEEQYRNLVHAPAGHQVIYGRNEQGIQFFREEIDAHTGS